MESTDRPGASGLKDFAERNHISRTHAYVEIRAGRLRTMKVGRRRLISPEAERDWRRLCERIAADARSSAMKSSGVTDRSSDGRKVRHER